jgi:hypothetical protein
MVGKAVRAKSVEVTSLGPAGIRSVHADSQVAAVHPAIEESSGRTV